MLTKKFMPKFLQNNMKILQVHKYYWHRDGASNYVLQLSAWLGQAGYSVIPFAMQEPESLSSPYDKFFVSNLDLGKPGQLSLLTKMQATARLFYCREAVQNLRRLLATQKIDVAHIHNIYHHLSPAILPVLKKAGARVVMTVHDYDLISPNYSLFHHNAIHEEDAEGYYFSCVKNKCVKDSRVYSAIKVAEMIWQHKLKKDYENNVDTFIAPSEFMAKKLIKYGYDKRKIVVIPNPVAVLEKSQLTKTGYIGFAGRLTVEKGVEVLLSAAKLLPHLEFKIAGAGPDEVRLQEICQEQKLTNVKLVGFKTGPALAEFLQQASILVVPSVWYENAPLSVLEPLAAGKIVLGSRIGGIPELLPAEFLFAPGNAEELADKIMYWQNVSVSERARVGKSLQALASYKYSPETHLKRILQVYQ